MGSRNARIRKSRYVAKRAVNEHAPVNVMVSLDDFTGGGSYQIISAPTTAKPGDVITIIVRRS